MSGTYALEREAAIHAARMASSLCRRVQQDLVTEDSITKKDKSPVTVADFGSQALVCRHLARVFPDDPVIGEESTEGLRSGEQAEILTRVVEQVNVEVPGAAATQVLDWIDRAQDQGGRHRVWTLDPIDGTKGFLRGEQYAVALALLEEGEVQVAVLGCPNLPATFGGPTDGGSLLVAVRGEGCFQVPVLAEGEPRRVHASPSTDFATARILESVEAAHGDHDAHARIKEHLGIGGASVRLDSQAKYGVLARGEAEIYLRMPTRPGYRECIWDQAAGSLVIEEAGGRVTDAFGRDLDFTQGRRLLQNRGIIATNGPLHDRLVEGILAVARPAEE